MTIELTADEVNAIVVALGLHSNYIQTGSVLTSATDLANIGDTKRRPKSLDTDQMRKVVAMADLREKLMRAESADFSKRKKLTVPGGRV